MGILWARTGSIGCIGGTERVANGGLPNTKTLRDLITPQTHPISAQTARPTLHLVYWGGKGGGDTDSTRCERLSVCAVIHVVSYELAADVCVVVPCIV